jgi:hypothetical protein
VKAMGGILPYAVVLAVVGGVIWWLLSRDVAAGPWLLAAVLIGHGIVHLMFAISPAATAGGPEWPFDMAKSWAVTGGLDLNVVRTVGVALIVIVAGGFALAALSTVGLVVPAEWWRAAVGGSAITSIVVLVLFFNPQLALGIGIDVVLLWAVAANSWAPA